MDKPEEIDAIMEQLTKETNESLQNLMSALGVLDNKAAAPSMVLRDTAVYGPNRITLARLENEIGRLISCGMTMTEINQNYVVVNELPDPTGERFYLITREKAEALAHDSRNNR